MGKLTDDDLTSWLESVTNSRQNPGRYGITKEEAEEFKQHWQ
jgi:hypothetical protein